MTSVDIRTRPEGSLDRADIDAFWDDEMPDLVGRNGRQAARCAALLNLPALTFEVENQVRALVVEDNKVRVTPRVADYGPIVSLNRQAFCDLINDVKSTFGLTMGNEVQLRRGTLEEFVAWEPALRTLIDGRPVYEPGTIDFRSADGTPLNLERSFSLDDPADQIGAFLADAGYLHLRSVFSAEEMRAVSTELESALADAQRDDDSSWWARTTDGQWYPCRILGFNQKSPTLRELLRSDRFRAIAGFTDDRFEQRNPDHDDCAEGLWKRVGVVEGPSDVSWHKDCALGGHSRGCSSLVVGISLTGSDATSGELGVVAGSHRANLQPLGLHPMLDLPRLPLPTGRGDITVHCSCTLHMSRPPVTSERQVVYTGFGLAPRPGEALVTTDHESARRSRLRQGNARRFDQDGVMEDRGELFRL